MIKLITLVIPVEMTASQIVRAYAVSKRDPPMSEAEALELAGELHAIIETMRPSPQPNPSWELADAQDAVRRTVLGFWPEDGKATASESCWIMEQLSSAANQSHPTDFALYDHIYDFATVFTGPTSPRPCHSMRCGSLDPTCLQRGCTSRP